MFIIRVHRSIVHTVHYWWIPLEGAMTSVFFHTRVHHKINSNGQWQTMLNFLIIHNAQKILKSSLSLLKEIKYIFGQLNFRFLFNFYGAVSAVFRTPSEYGALWIKLLPRASPSAAGDFVVEVTTRYEVLVGAIPFRARSSFGHVFCPSPDGGEWYCKIVRIYFYWPAFEKYFWASLLRNAECLQTSPLQSLSSVKILCLWTVTPHLRLSHFA